jgi:hypothetical protein
VYSLSFRASRHHRSQSPTHQLLTTAFLFVFFAAIRRFLGGLKLFALPWFPSSMFFLGGFGISIFAAFFSPLG